MTVETTPPSYLSDRLQDDSFRFFFFHRSDALGIWRPNVSA
jgi:hypothetical protein